MITLTLRKRLHSTLNRFSPLQIYAIGYVDAVLTIGIVAIVVTSIQGGAL